MLHSATFKTELLKDNHILLTENCFYEDFEYTFYTLPFINTVKYYEKPIYYYLVGQKTQSVNAASALKNINMYERVIYHSIDYFEMCSNKVSNSLKKYMSKCLTDYIRSMYL